MNAEDGEVVWAFRSYGVRIPLLSATGQGCGDRKEYLLYQNNAGVQLVVHPRVTAQEVQDTPDDQLLARLRSTIEEALPAAQRAA